MRKNICDMLFIVLVLSAVFAAPVFGYLDPGSGSAILQVIVAAFAGLAVAIKMNWHRLVNLFRKNKKPINKPDSVKAEDK